MEQSQNQQKKKQVRLMIIGVAILVIGLVGITYAFFNYTRTGASNVIKTGRIYFNSEQGNSINLTNVFPVDVSNGIPNNNANVGSVTINVTGDTTYTDGMEYLVSAVNVQNTVGSGANAKTLPISVEVSVESNTGNDPATTLGTADANYFTNRGASANTSIYKVLAKDTISNNDQLLVGYIKSGATGVDGNIVIRAYIDASKVAISDTYPEQTVRTVITTNYSSSNCETVLAGVQDASTYCASTSALQAAIDNGNLTNAQINLLVTAGIVEEYIDGTTSEWVGDRTVFTTSEWNNLQQNGISFQVKVESNEGIWVEKPVQGIESCPNCKFIYLANTSMYTASNMAGTDPVSGDPAPETPTILTTGLYDDYQELVTATGKNYFLGVKLNSSNQVTNAYVCGVKGSEPFCIEGADETTYTNIKTLLQGENLYDNTCIVEKVNAGTADEAEYIECGPWDNTLISADANSRGFVIAGVGDYDLCTVDGYGYFDCLESD